ncbi:MAG: arginine--tRNA ligase, partial [Spirochaetaceae bacterium]|nr:arginine--tRNA ligase [Spirochaetaceae bacterium]
MFDDVTLWKQKTADALNALAAGAATISAENITVSAPPDPALGDITIALFPFAKQLRKSPAQIAAETAALLQKECGKAGVTAAGPYLNIRIDRMAAARVVLERIFDTRSNYWRISTLTGKKIMVEFSSPNTNKPLHLGHLRNDALGMSISRILEACGAQVQKVCIINNRGIHICKSMLAYMDEGAGSTPEKVGEKSDHFVGDWYVRFSIRLKSECESIIKEKNIPADEAESQSNLLARARKLLVKWEQGDEQAAALWKQ